MTERERWIVYPLLFLALGAALRDKLVDRTTTKTHRVPGADDRRRRADRPATARTLLARIGRIEAHVRRRRRRSGTSDRRTAQVIGRVRWRQYVNADS